MRTIPTDFALGVASSSYQIEGGWNQGGKGESIWDRYTHMKQLDDTGDVAADHYHRYEEDINILAQVGVDSYRFSISWPRVFPNGTGVPNEEGIQFYKNILNLLKKNGIKAAVTLYHWDLPQALQDKGGWTNRETADAFASYAAYVFKELGNDVDVWITHNEPWVVAFMGYGYGKFAPGLTDYSAALLACHNILLSHGKAVAAYRELGLKGKIGISLCYFPSVPYTNSQDDELAALRDRQSHIGWFADPIYFGKYPEYTWNWYQEKKIVMPNIEPSDMEIISQKIDFLGVNYYRGAYVKHQPGDFPLDSGHASSDMEKTSRRFTLKPYFLFDYLKYLNERYGPNEIMITENGFSSNEFLDRNGEVNDDYRIDYIHRHLDECLRAIDSGMNVTAYYLWCFLDSFEWISGFKTRMGIVYVDYESHKRTIKKSGLWYQRLIADRRL